MKAKATRSARPARPPTTPPTTVPVGAVVLGFPDPEGTPEVVDADDDEGVLYTLVAAELSPPPAPYVADPDPGIDDQPVDDNSVEVELLELEVELEDWLEDALLLVEPELASEDVSVVPSAVPSEDDDDDWNSVVLAPHVLVVTVLLGRVYVDDNRDEDGRKEVYDAKDMLMQDF